MKENRELYLTHRPKFFCEMTGQEAAISTLEGMVRKGRTPHTVLFSGGSGVGKTSMARILAASVDCFGDDLVEVNCADFTGVDVVREIRNQINTFAMFGKSRVWIIDEVHSISKAAQQAFLKILEETPDHVYFFLCTTDPGKLLETIRTRCTEIKLSSIPADLLEKRVREVAKKEKIQLTDEVVERITEVSEGSLRKALVLLNQIMYLDSEQERLDAILPSDAKRKATELFYLLLNGKTKWPDVIKLLKSIEEEPETLRRIVLGCATAEMNKNKNLDKAFLVLVAFENDFFASNKAGLYRACFEVIRGG